MSPDWLQTTIYNIFSECILISITISETFIHSVTVKWLLWKSSIETTRDMASDLSFQKQNGQTINMIIKG